MRLTGITTVAARLLRGPAAMSVLLLTLALMAGACGNEDEGEPGSSEEDGWRYYRALEPGDCFRLEGQPVVVDCEDDDWEAQVYATLDGDDAVGPCPTPGPEYDTDDRGLAGMNVPTGDPLLICWYEPGPPPGSGTPHF